MTKPEPCPYDGAHEPGQPIPCWSPGGPCEVPNAPDCETCGPCNHCDPDKSPKWADLFGIDPTFDQPEQAGVDREGLAEVVMAASPGTPTLTALKIADALADLLAARDRRVRAEAVRDLAAETLRMPADPAKVAHWLRDRADRIEAER